MSRKSDPLKDMETAYRLLFGSKAAKDVLADLRVFCHATMTTAGRDESIERLEGRREVFLRIMTFLKVDVEDFYSYELDDYE